MQNQMSAGNVRCGSRPTPSSYQSVHGLLLSTAPIYLVLLTFRMSAGDPSSIQAQAIASSSVIACPSAHAVSNAASSNCDGRIPMGHLRTLLLPGTKADAKEVVEDPQRSRVDQLAIASLGMVEVKGDGIVEHTGRIASVDLS